MNGFGNIKSRTLQDFLNDPDAPPGFVYFVDDEPAVQIDLLEDFFTLFWLGSTNLETFISTFPHIVDDVKSGPPFAYFYPVAPVFEGFASAVVDQWRPSMTLSDPRKKPVPARYKRFSRAIGPAETKSIYSLKDHLYAFVEPFSSYTVAIQCELKATLYNRDYYLSLWADTEDSKKEHKETGITSNLPLTESLVGLLAQTCPAASQMPRSDFDMFVKTIRGDISDRRNY